MKRNKHAVAGAKGGAAGTGAAKARSSALARKAARARWRRWREARLSVAEATRREQVRAATTPATMLARIQERSRCPKCGYVENQNETTPAIVSS